MIGRQSLSQQGDGLGADFSQCFDRVATHRAVFVVQRPAKLFEGR